MSTILIKLKVVIYSFIILYNKNGKNHHKLLNILVYITWRL
jgi:hypothetical protein